MQGSQLVSAFSLLISPTVETQNLASLSNTILSIPQKSFSNSEQNRNFCCFNLDITREDRAMKSDENTSANQQQQAKELKEPLKTMVENIHWYGQSSVRIPYKAKLIYIDPFMLTENEPAAVVLITHPHSDHFSIDEIKKVASHNTPIYAPKECGDKLRALGFTNCVDVVPGQTFHLEDITFETVPAYNTIKTNHPKEKNWVGYVLTLGNIKIYHPGDTNRIPEMKAIHCDIAFMPLGQTYTMQNVQEAVDAVLDVTAKVAIPIHYGMYEGAEENALQFKQLLGNKAITVIKESKNKLQLIH
jgi:L-ascorbate metabolism protein UlaG (beta-lactamase superfamily)